MLPLAETMLFGNQPFIADMTAYAISNKSKTAIKMKTDYERRAKLICKKLAKTKNIRPIMPKSGMFILIKLELKIILTKNLLGSFFVHKVLLLCLGLHLVLMGKIL